MAATNYSECLAFVLQSEGGYVNNPRDPGGPTNKGITLRTLQHYQEGATVVDVRNIPDATVAAIYRGEYWNVMHGDALPGGVDAMVFDFGVNAGPARSVRFLQGVVGSVPDGAIGPLTLAKVAAMSAGQIIERLDERQRAHYESLDTFDTFGDGWMARTDRRTALAKRLMGS